MEVFSLSKALIEVARTFSGDNGADRLQNALESLKQDIRSAQRIIGRKTAVGNLRYISLDENELHNFDENRVKENK